jgi:stress response protein YsnF
VREEVDVRKEVDRETVEVDERLRKERLDVDSEGNPVVRDANNPLDPRR